MRDLLDSVNAMISYVLAVVFGFFLGIMGSAALAAAILIPLYKMGIEAPLWFPNQYLVMFVGGIVGAIWYVVFAHSDLQKEKTRRAQDERDRLKEELKKEVLRELREET